jgi:hypothetical protein
MFYPSIFVKDNLSFEKSNSYGFSGQSKTTSVSTSLTPSSPPPASKLQSSKSGLVNDPSSLSFDKESNSNSNFVAALKEWAIVCKAAEDGNQVLLFRKGGIMEYRNGFELKHKNFFLFPTFEHQSMESIREEYKKEFENLTKQHEQKDLNSTVPNDSQIFPDTTTINSFVEISYFNEINDINKLEKLEKFHIWNLDYVKMRFNYNPKKPLFLVLLRTYKLKDAIKIHNKPEWSGCKSWIQIDLKDKALEAYFKNDLAQSFEYLKSISIPSIDDGTFNNITEEIRGIV